MRKTFTFSASSSGCGFNFLPSTIAWQHRESDYMCLEGGRSASKGVLPYVLTLATTDIVKGLLMSSSCCWAEALGTLCFKAGSSRHQPSPLGWNRQQRELTHLSDSPDFYLGLAKVRQLGQEPHSDLCTVASSLPGAPTGPEEQHRQSWVHATEGPGCTTFLGGSGV